MGPPRRSAPRKDSRAPAAARHSGTRVSRAAHSIARRVLPCFAATILVLRSGVAARTRNIDETDFVADAGEAQQRLGIRRIPPRCVSEYLSRLRSKVKSAYIAGGSQA